MNPKSLYDVRCSVCGETFNTLQESHHVRTDEKGKKVFSHFPACPQKEVRHALHDFYRGTRIRKH